MGVKLVAEIETGRGGGQALVGGGGRDEICERISQKWKVYVLAPQADRWWASGRRPIRFRARSSSGHAAREGFSLGPMVRREVLLFVDTGRLRESAVG